MSKPIPSCDEQALGDRLRREAEATRPPFSEPLHAQLWLALQQANTPEAMAQTRSPRARRSPPWLLAVAISASLLAAVVAWQNREPTTQLTSTGSAGQAAQETSPFDEAAREAEWGQLANLTDGVAEQVNTWLNVTLTRHRWAYLDHDAKAILETVVPFGLTSFETSEEPAAPTVPASSCPRKPDRPTRSQPSATSS